MTEDNKYGIEDLISNAVDLKPLEFADVFNNLILDRLHTVIDNKKMEVAQQLYGYQPEQQETEESED
jgi:predicted Zn-dependent protease with MMP-like domain